MHKAVIHPQFPINEPFTLYQSKLSRTVRTFCKNWRPPIYRRSASSLAGGPMCARQFDCQMRALHNILSIIPTAWLSYRCARDNNYEGLAYITRKHSPPNIAASPITPWSTSTNEGRQIRSPNLWFLADIDGPMR